MQLHLKTTAAGNTQPAQPERLTAHLRIPAEAPWQMHDPLLQQKSFYGMLFALTPSGGHLWQVYFNYDVRADYHEYGTDNAHGFDMTFEEWVGVAPFRWDTGLVWC